MYKRVYTEVEVDVELSDFDTEDLIEELESRGAGWNTWADGNELIQRIHQLRRTGGDYQRELDELIWFSMGKIA